MDVSMQLVEQQCGRYLASYSKCLAIFPDTWHLDCDKQKIKLAACAESEPTIVHIKTVCAMQFNRYETCMLANPVQSERCATQYEEFKQCAERISKN